MANDYIPQVQRGIDYIEANLHQKLVLSSVSQAAGLSHFHFQRIFRAVTGESLAQYTKARRLSVALRQLQDRNQRIVDVALDAGYQTHESFTRAFKAHFGVTPSAYRNHPITLPVVPKPRIDEAYLRHLFKDAPPPPIRMKRSPQRVIGLSTRYDGGSRHKNTLGANLFELWQAFIHRAHEVSDAQPGPFFGVLRVLPDPEGEVLEYVAARPVSENAQPPDGMVAADIPGGMWAVFTHHGLPKAINHTIDYVYGAWLLQSGVRHTGGPDIEVYGPEWEPHSPTSMIRYAIPITV